MTTRTGTTTTAVRLWSVVESPVGPLLLSGDERALTGLRFGGGPSRASAASWRRDDARFRPEGQQLAEYFAGRRTAFDVPLTLGGTPIERRVWDALLAIPHGTTTTYGELAVRVGAPGEARAVGSANARNPIAIVVPCHRVIGAGGKLTGYAGGVERKRALLAHEGAILA
jgi:methylated-DNA-[protein]-cysteine S-methyltransferase